MYMYNTLIAMKQTFDIKQVEEVDSVETVELNVVCDDERSDI